MASSEQLMSLPLLTAMVVGGLVGAGIFSLPRTFANATGSFGALVAWLIAGSGMYMIIGPLVGICMLATGAVQI